MRLPGPWELAIILAIVLVIFGAGRLPEIGSSLGRGLRAFKRGIGGTAKEESSSDKAEDMPTKTDPPG